MLESNGRLVEAISVVVFVALVEAMKSKRETSKVRASRRIFQANQSNADTLHARRGQSNKKKCIVAFTVTLNVMD